MSLIRLVLVAFVATIVALLIAPLVFTAHAASACRLVEVEGKLNRIRFAAQNADLILIGVVTAEAPSRELHSRPGMFDSTIQTEAVIKGWLAAPELTLTGLNNPNDCVESPRLMQGERVLIQLFWSYEREDHYVWRVSPIAGKVVLASDGQAVLDEIEDPDDGPAGDVEDVVLAVAHSSGASQKQIDRALLAARRASPHVESAWDLPILLALTLSVAASVGLLCRRLRPA